MYQVTNVGNKEKSCKTKISIHMTLKIYKLQRTEFCICLCVRLLFTVKSHVATAAERLIAKIVVLFEEIANVLNGISTKMKIEPSLRLRFSL